MGVIELVEKIFADYEAGEATRLAPRLKEQIEAANAMRAARNAQIRAESRAKAEALAPRSIGNRFKVYLSKTSFVSGTIIAAEVAEMQEGYRGSRYCTWALFKIVLDLGNGKTRECKVTGLPV